MENQTDGAVSIRYRRNARRLLTLGTLVLFVLSVRLLPEAKWSDYALGAVALALFFLHARGARLAAQADGKRPIRAMLLAVAALDVAVLSLIVVHTVKLDAARADVPAEGQVRLRFTYDGDVYSSVTGFVEDMETALYVENAPVGNGESATVLLGARTEFRCTTSFSLSGQHFEGEWTIKAQITGRNVQNGYSVRFTIPCGDDTSCVVACEATYEPTFWEVVFH